MARRRLIWNTVANYTGRMLSAVLNVAFVPLYVRFLGTEAFGLIGVFIALQGMMALFDLGLSATLNREMARHAAAGAPKSKNADLIVTFEVAYWALSAAIAALIFAFAPFAATHWLHATTLAPSALITAICLMGLVVSINWPVGLYSGGLLGLQEHVLLNMANGVFGLLRYGGAAIVLWLFSSTITAYFLWQLAASVAQVLFLRHLLWRESGCRPTEGKYRFTELLERKDLIFGIGGSYIALIVFTQVDKLVVSRFVSLQAFGQYAIAGTAMGLFYFFYSPISATLYPRITTFCGQSRLDLAVREYQFGSQLTALFIFPTCAILCVFSRELVGFWLNDAGLAVQSHLLIRYLAPGAAIAALLSMCNMLQWAEGWTSVGLWTNVAGIVAMIPSVAFFARRDGVLAAIIACAVVKTIQALLQLLLTHRRLMPNRQVAWVFELFSLVLFSVALALVARFVLPIHVGRAQLLLYLAAVWTLTIALGLWIPATTRAAARNLLQTRLSQPLSITIPQND
jgi:O-antigen/teichoic acid export membrane protein